MSRLRLLKVVCQAVFVLDDGESLTELVTEPVTVQAEEWPSFASERFVAGAAELRARLGCDDDEAGRTVVPE